MPKKLGASSPTCRQRRGVRTTRLRRPLQRRSSARMKARDDATASTASRSSVRDDGQRPSLGTGRVTKATDLPEKKSRKFFDASLDRPNHHQIASKNRFMATPHQHPGADLDPVRIRILRRGGYLPPTRPLKLHHG